jgi:hypothetical protein
VIVVVEDVVDCAAARRGRRRAEIVGSFISMVVRYAPSIDLQRE